MDRCVVNARTARRRHGTVIEQGYATGSSPFREQPCRTAPFNALRCERSGQLLYLAVLQTAAKAQPMTRPPGFFVGTEMPTAGWWEALWPDPAGVLKAVGANAGMAAIDLCCGDGWFTLPLARIAREVTALDIDPQMLDVARQRLAESGVANVRFVAADAYQLPDIVPAAVDFVFMANAFHGVPDPVRLASAVRLSLGRDGAFAIVNWHQRPREETTVLGEPRGPSSELRLSPKQTIGSVTAGGLKLLRQVEVPPYHYAVIFGRTE